MQQAGEVPGRLLEPSLGHCYRLVSIRTVFLARLAQGIGLKRTKGPVDDYLSGLEKCGTVESWEMLDERCVFEKKR